MTERQTSPFSISEKQIRYLSLLPDFLLLLSLLRSESHINLPKDLSCHNIISIFFRFSDTVQPHLFNQSRILQRIFQQFCQLSTIPQYLTYAGACLISIRNVSRYPSYISPYIPSPTGIPFSLTCFTASMASSIPLSLITLLKVQTRSGLIFDTFNSFRSRILYGFALGKTLHFPDRPSSVPKP